MKYIPKEIVPTAHHWLILHGRYFCVNGVVMSDRETTPKYWEVKKVYAPVKLEMEN